MTDPVPTRPASSIVIVTYNGRDYIETCLQALLAQIGEQDEIIVVDNNSDDGSADLVASLFLQVVLLRQTVNRGFVWGCNFGAAQAQGKVLVFLNQDTRVAPGWLTSLVDGLADESVGLTTSQVLLMDQPDRLHLAGQAVHYTGLVFGRGFGETAEKWQKAENVAAVSGASFAIKRTLWERLNGMDELFFMYYEETDLSWRTILHGYVCRYMPPSVVYHDYQAGQPGYGRMYHTFRNRYLLLLKNYRWRTLWLLWPGLAMAELLEWGLALSHGKIGLQAKINANIWLIRQRKIIMQTRHVAQSQRKKSDGELLTVLMDRITPQAMPGGWPGHILLLITNRLCQLNYLLALTICQWRGW